MDTDTRETPEPIRTDSPGRKAGLLLERSETRIKHHQKQQGQCENYPFENCPACGGDDLRRELAAMLN